MTQKNTQDSISKTVLVKGKLTIPCQELRLELSFMKFKKLLRTFENFCKFLSLDHKLINHRDLSLL